MGRSVRHKADLARLVRRALSEGARITGLGVVHWNLAADCQRPFSFTLEGRDPAFLEQGIEAGKPNRTFNADGFDGVGPYPGAPLWLDMEVQCRKCPACLKRRGARWAYRAQEELAVAPRTWLVTMTFRPEERFKIDMEADRRLSKRGVEFRSLSSEQRFLERHISAGSRVTKYLKRIRKESQAKLRYLLVVEAHRCGHCEACLEDVERHSKKPCQKPLEGFPHYHMLMHEVRPEQTVKWECITRQWWDGFSTAKLVDTSNARTGWYVCKYLSKAALARVRASACYGKQTLSRIDGFSRRERSPTTNAVGGVPKLG